MNYKTVIKNGVTIISTGDAVGGLKNKTGHVGIHHFEKENKYLAKISIGKKYYHLGKYDNIEDAVTVRAEAEKHRAAGTFEEWLGAIRRRPRNK